MKETIWYMENDPIDLISLVEILYEKQIVHKNDTYSDRDTIEHLLKELFLRDSSCISLSDGITKHGQHIHLDSMSDEEIEDLKQQSIIEDFSDSRNLDPQCKIPLPCLVRLLIERNVEYPSILDYGAPPDKGSVKPIGLQLATDELDAEHTKTRSADDLLAEMTNPTSLMEVMCSAHKATNTKDKELYSKMKIAGKENYLHKNYRVKKSEAKYIGIVIAPDDNASTVPSLLMEITVKAHIYLWHTDEGKQHKTQSQRRKIIITKFSLKTENTGKAILNIISSPEIKKGGWV